MTHDMWLVSALALCFALGFLVGRRDADYIKTLVVNASFWQGFDVGYKARDEEELDNEEEL